MGNGDDIKDWETTGLDPRGDPDTRWKINLDEDGMVTWTQMDEDTPDYGDEFFIQGTHNNWMPEALERHDSIIGLWMSTLSIGSEGEEQFQIIADEDDLKCYCPNQSRCSLKAAPINGPVKANRELTWLV